MFEQTFKNIDDILHKDAGCGNELDYVEWRFGMVCGDPFRHGNIVTPSGLYRGVYNNCYNLATPSGLINHVGFLPIP